MNEKTFLQNANYDSGASNPVHYSSGRMFTVNHIRVQQYLSEAGLDTYAGGGIHVGSSSLFTASDL